MIHNYLSTALLSQDRTVKEDALEVILIALSQIPNRRIISATFFPGILSSLVKIITGDFKQGYKLYVLAFKYV